MEMPKSALDINNELQSTVLSENSVKVFVFQVLL